MRDLGSSQDAVGHPTKRGNTQRHEDEAALPEQPPLCPLPSDRDTQLARLMRRNSLSREDAEARINAQLPLKDKVHLASHVLDNSGEWSLTKRQTVQLYAELERSLEYLPLRLGILAGLACVISLLHLLVRCLMSQP